jgi:tetratricopeptide (TPR) repeat protein
MMRPSAQTSYRAGRLVTTAALVAGFALASAWTVRVAWADHNFQQLTVAATERALALTPDRADYWVRLALLVSGDDPARSAEAFERAAALNPLDANAWVELGLGSENRGDLATAERCLLRAAEVDRGYLPRWSLANYYFRRQDAAQFWPWVGQAAAMAYGDASPLFRLCWSFTEDGDRIAALLAIHRPSMQASYLGYLLEQNRMAYVTSAARRLLAWNRAEDTALVLKTCEQLLNQTRPAKARREAPRETSLDALEIWNALARSRRVPGVLLAPDAGVSLTNGRFVTAPSSRGFDWQLPAVEGISHAHQENPTGIRFSFSGRQPQKCEFLEQLLPVLGNRRYTLAFRYRTAGVPSGSGLRWRVLDEGMPTGRAPGGNRSPILAHTESLSADEETPGEFSFQTDAPSRLLRLSLGYERAPGSTRIEGSLTLRNVQLTLTPR